MLKRVLHGALAAAGLAACASSPSLSADQCASMDWRALGLRDGRAGQSMTALNDEIRLCEPYGIAPDLDLYKAGRDEGLAAYCQPAAILDAAVQGGADPYVCEPVTDEIKTAFDTGRETRAAAVRYQQVRRQYEQLGQAREAINREGAELSQALQTASDPAVRERIAARLGYLQGRREAVDARLREAGPVMEKETATYEAAVKRYESFKAGLTE